MGYNNMSLQAPKTCHFKLVLLGDTAVGKSCLLVRFVRDEFFEFQEPTIGAAFLTQLVNINGSIVKFEIWDTAGQERYRSLAPMYYRGAQAAIVVYDITHALSFEKAKLWVKELKRRASPGILIALAANKKDLSSKRTISERMGQDYAKQESLLFLETSPKTGENVKGLFELLAEALPEKTEELDLARPRGDVNLKQPP